MPEKLTIGLDVGGTKMAFVVADRQGNICDDITIPTHANNDYNITLDRIAHQLNQYLSDFKEVEGIGIGVPGPVNNKKGIAINAVNLLWQDVPVVDGLKQRLSRPLPIYMENDVNVGAIGEQLYGVAQGVSNYVYLAIGTGIGGAVMLDNGIMRGTSYSEMEIGHVSLDPVHGRKCTCGLTGCVEMSISGKGFVANAKQHYADYPDTTIPQNNITTREIINQAQNGDTLANFVIDEGATTLGIACAWCTNLFNPRQIILGGGLIQATYNLMKDKMLVTLEERTLRQPFEAVTISLSKLTNAALGASALVWYYKQENG